MSWIVPQNQFDSYELHISPDDNNVGLLLFAMYVTEFKNNPHHLKITPFTNMAAIKSLFYFCQINEVRNMFEGKISI